MNIGEPIKYYNTNVKDSVFNEVIQSITNKLWFSIRERTTDKIIFLRNTNINEIR